MSQTRTRTLFLFLVIVQMTLFSGIYMWWNQATRESQQVIQQHIQQNDDLNHELESVLSHFNAMPGKLVTNGFKPQNDCIPIVIYCWNRPQFLKMVLESLSQAQGIENTILLIAQDGYDPVIGKLIRQIDFMPFISLIRPTSSNHPSSLSNLKSMWWWTLHQTFEVFKIHKFSKWQEVLFLEEDHVVSPDFIKTLKFMIPLKNQLEPIPYKPLWGCALYNWGKTKAIGDSSQKQFDLFFGNSNRGYTFNVSIFKQLKNVKEEFFAFNEGWDWTLFHLMQVEMLPEVFLVPRLSRLREVGYTGHTTHRDEFESREFVKISDSVDYDFNGFQLDLTFIHDKQPTEIEKIKPV